MNLEFYKHVELESEVEDLKIVLSDHKIPFEISSSEAIIDKTIVGSGLFANYTVKIRPEDFELANQLLLKLVEERDISIEDYQHLTELTNDELVEILTKPSEWSIESGVIAKKILNSRNYKISKEEIEALRTNHYNELFKEKSASRLVQLGYFLAIILGFFINPILIIAGFGMSYYYAFGKATNPKGYRNYIYDLKSREIGKLMLVAGILGLIIQVYLIVKIYIFQTI